jgi:hypothetical protein
MNHGKSYWASQHQEHKLTSICEKSTQNCVECFEPRHLLFNNKFEYRTEKEALAAITACLSRTSIFWVQINESFPVSLGLGWQSCNLTNGGFGPHLSESKMDYYQPPTDHPNALEMERLQEQMDALVKQRQHLETLEYTEAVEIQHAAVEEQISFLRGLAKEIQHG